jgi:metal-sulfur cluster biosynthetic enzyme
MIDRDRLLPEIWDQLDGIAEPCSIAMGNRISLVEMGLIDDIAIADDGIVTITLCLTDTACVHYLRMQAYITDALSPLAGITSVQVKQTLDKLWTDDRVKRKVA